MKNIYLKPCPFCGGPARIEKCECGDCYNMKTYYGITCSSECCWLYDFGEPLKDTEEEAAELWNRRRI
jgi:hypothetical protein